MKAAAALDPREARFRLGPLCRAIAADDFARWLDIAQDGDFLDYAWGPARPKSFPVVCAVDEAVEAGTVRCHVVREGGEIAYRAFRRKPAGGCARGAALPRDAGRMLAILSETADRGLCCPTNAVLAIALGLKDAEAARYVFGQLLAADYIAVENRGPKARRIVTIIATGARTAPGRIGQETARASRTGARKGGQG